MDTEKIIQDLNRRFGTPLPDFHNRRVIFWYDEDQEFEDQIDEIALENAKVIKLTGNNRFAVKKLLSADDLNSNYLVYCPLSYDKPDDNWLLNIELYSGEPFRADLNTIWMDEMGLPVSQLLRKQVKHYHRFFNAKDRRQKFSAFSDKISTPTQLHLGVMTTICGCKDMQPNSIVRAILKAGLNQDENPVYQSLINYGAETPFWVLINQATGYQNGDHPELGALAIHIFLTALTRTIRKEHLAGLDAMISTPHQAWCYDFVSEWLRTENDEKLYEISRYVENEMRLTQRLSKLEVEDIVEAECLPCINEIVLLKLMTNISDHIIQPETICQIVEKRRTKVWYDFMACYYDGLYQVALMQAFFDEHATGFHTVDPMKLWNEYTSDYYRMDQYYRQYHICFQKSLKKSNPLLDDLFKQVTDRVEGLYSVWFLGNLSSNWSTIAADSLKETGTIDQISKQSYFYSQKVRPADTRVFVIISDALRYEVAASLADQLKRETQSKVSLEGMCGIFPTITPYGMAALLPHTKLTVEPKNNGLGILADGLSTEANNREKVLQQANPASVALQYKNIIGMKKAERQELVKGKEVIYIYHDKIDEASHTSDAAVFTACEEAIEEIKNIVRIICNEFSGKKIYITADHGFLYTYQPLNEDAKVDKSSWNGQEVDFGRRYAIMQKGAQPEHLLPVKYTLDPDHYDAFAPSENIRIKMYGGGLNYVHGGISLQEMCVPLIDYTYLRTDSKEYQKNKSQYDTKPVTISLYSANRKISNMIFGLNFYQTEPVSGNREAARYLLYFTDSAGLVVSDTVKIIADKTGASNQDRTFHCNFNLKSLQYDNKQTYYLVIADETGLQLPVKEAFQIDIAFAVDEFNFF